LPKPTGSDSRFISVMGVGRCGSSAVAGMLHHGGVPMGRNLIGPHERFNARGHYEDHMWHRLNREIAYQCLPAIPQAAVRNETDRYEYKRDWSRERKYLQRYQAFVADYEAPIWGMKCIMLGVIWPYVRDCFGDDVRIIVVERDRDAVIRSRMEHSQIDYDEARYLVDALQEGIDAAMHRHYGMVIKLHYEYVLKQPRSIAQLLKGFTGLDSFDVDAAAAHIDPSLNHANERELACA